jgi:transglutaminase-like putative cysteine protease
VNYSEYKSYVPDYYVYNVRQKGYLFPKITTEKNSRAIEFLHKADTPGGLNIRGTSSSQASMSKFDYLETKTTYIIQNLPALKEESYVNNINNYTASLVQELSVIKEPNSPVKSLSTDWNSVTKTIYEFDDFGVELNKTGYFEDDLKILLIGLNTPEEKTAVIFNYVKSHVKWNGYYNYSCEDGVRKAYKDKTGNVAEINLMLTAMLRYAGLTANPVLVSTRSNGIANFPNRTAFNYLITAVETPGGNVLLDASDKFSVPNVLPLRALNWYGRLIRKDGTSEQIDLMPKKSSNDIIFMSYSVDSAGKVTGKTRRQCSDYNAMIFRNNVNEIKEETYLERLENENENIEISEYDRKNEKELILPTTETYSFTGSNLSELIGEKIYVSPMLFFTNNENPFKQESREYPVDFGFPFSDKYNITINIPEGYVVETLPQAAVMNMEDNLGSFKFNIVANGNLLQLSISHQINEAIVPVEKYEMLKEYYKAMIAKESEKIVLKRI